jgi:phage baseplate assembly protein W
MALYKGFSTIGRGSRWKLSDTELVKRDILNQFQTRKGERLMKPDFGSDIWSFTFEQMGDDLRESIIADAQRIIDSDGRVVSNGIVVREFQNGFQIEMDLFFVTTDVSDNMFVQFNAREQILTSF